MALRLKGACFSRAAVAAVTLMIPLVAVGTAQAAVAGAAPEKTSNRPDLTSATILSGATGGGGFVDFCFDKSIALGSADATATSFELGGYRSQNLTPQAGTPALEQNSSGNTPPFNCVRAGFASSAGDLDQYTIAQVGPNAVTAQGGSSNPLTDSTALTGSNTHNGTANFTAAPDLSGLFVDKTSNTITYIEDQNVGAVTSSTDFYFTDGGGNTCQAAASASAVGTGAGANEVTVSFAGNSCDSGTTTEDVSNAVRAGQDGGAVNAANDTSVTNVEDEATVPGTSGATSRPDLISTKLESNHQAIDYTFDANVSPDFASCFVAGLSTGDEIRANTAQVINASNTSTTIRAVFPNLTSYSEYVVKGAVLDFGTAGMFGSVGSDPSDGCAVFTGSGTNSIDNTPGSTPAGDNAGAFARGFTTGSDAFAAVLSKSTGNLAIMVDQRSFTTPTPGNIQLLDGTGNTVDTASAGGVSFPSQAAGPETINVQFTPNDANSAQNLYLGADAFETGIGQATASPSSSASCQKGSCTNQPNVAQILAITTTAALARQAHRAETAKPVSRAYLARRAARQKRASRARLAKMRRQARRHHRAAHHR